MAKAKQIVKLTPGVGLTYTTRGGYIAKVLETNWGVVPGFPVICEVHHDGVTTNEVYSAEGLHAESPGGYRHHKFDLFREVETE